MVNNISDLSYKSWAQPFVLTHYDHNNRSCDYTSCYRELRFYFEQNCTSKQLSILNSIIIAFIRTNRKVKG